MGFDWTKVDGYNEQMSADEKLALLDNYEPEEPEPDPAKLKGFIPKAQFDKALSELASMKKQLRSKMTEDEQAAADRAASEEAMKAELAQLRHEKTVSTYKAGYLAQGYDDQMAGDAAVAMADGDMETVFAIMKKQSMNAEKALRAQILKEAPVPPADNGNAEEAKERERLNRIRGYMGLPKI